jgi:uncharacterized protein YndB with AHSA1/START domain
MRYEIEVDIDSTPEAVWAVLADVERWPEWTPSMTLVRRLEDGSVSAARCACGSPGSRRRGVLAGRRR